MQPQGSSIINTAYFAEQQAQFEACTVCAELQSQVNTVMASLQAGKDAIADQLALLSPVLALLASPAANPAAIVTWIENFITDFLTPYTVPYANYATQLTELTVQVAGLADAIENAARNIPNCSITIPPLT